jgi:hypothetical protein
MMMGMALVLLLLLLRRGGWCKEELGSCRRSCWLLLVAMLGRGRGRVVILTIASLLLLQVVGLFGLLAYASCSWQRQEKSRESSLSKSSQICADLPKKRQI